MSIIPFFEIQKKSAQTLISYAATNQVSFSVVQGYVCVWGGGLVFLYLQVLYFAELIQFMDHPFSIPCGLFPPILCNTIPSLSQQLPTQVSMCKTDFHWQFGSTNS